MGVGDAFCTRCGSPLTLDAGSSRPSQHWRWIVVLGIVALAALLALCATGWRREVSAHRSANRELVAAQTRVAELRATLSTSHALSGHRGQVMARVDAVLRQINPLLASSDELRQAASTLESQSTRFTTAATSLQNDAVELAKRLAGGGTAAGKAALATVDAEVAALRADGYTLTSRGGRLAAAVTLFATRADEYRSSVRALQGELRP